MSSEKKIDKLDLTVYLVHLKEAWKLVRKRLVIIIILGIIGGIAGYLYASWSKPIFKATVTFILDEDADRATPGVTSLSKQLLDKQGGAAKKELLLDLLKSRKLIENTLLTKIVLYDVNDYLFNHYLRTLPPASGDEPYKFITDTMQLTERQTLIQEVAPSLTSAIETEVQRSGIMKMTFSDRSHAFTMAFTTTHVDALIDYYIRQKTEKSRKTLQFTEERKDSIFGSLQAAEYRLAAFKDQNQGLVKVRGGLDELRLTRDLEILNAMYAEVVKNLETSKLFLMEQRPVVQVVDYPIYPLEMIVKSKITYVALGGFLMGFIGVLLSLLPHYFRKYIKLK